MNKSILEGWSKESLHAFIDYMPEGTLIESENNWQISGKHASAAMARVYAANGREKEIGSTLFKRDVSDFLAEIAMKFQDK